MPAEYRTIPYYGNVEITYYVAGDVVWYKGRDIGLALHYGAKGGNLTRHVFGKWRDTLISGLHLDIRERRAIWLSSSGLLVVMGLIFGEEPARRDAVRELNFVISKHELRHA